MPSHRTIFDLGFNDGSDTAGFLSQGYHVVAVEANRALVDQQSAKELDDAMADLCSLVELPELDLSLVEPEKEWWLCPGATLDDGEECQTVYYDGETQIACAY